MPEPLMSGTNDGWREGQPDQPALATQMQAGSTARPGVVGIDSALGRTLHGWFSAPRTQDPRLRRLQGIELLIVLGLFPLGSAIVAVDDLIERIQSGVPVVSHAYPPVSGDWLALGLAFLALLPSIAIAALVLYLLVRSGEGARAINLDSRRWRMDLALLLPVFFLVFWLPQWLGMHVVTWSHLSGYFLAFNVQNRPVLLIGNALAGAAAGIVEEVVVLGFLVRRLEQRGYHPVVFVAIAVVVRVSYHVYYGWDAIPIAIWAIVSVLVYLRIRRLLPFILCHAAYDVLVSLRVLYPAAHTVIWIYLVLATALMSIAWWRWTPRASDDEDPELHAPEGAAAHLS